MLEAIRRAMSFLRQKQVLHKLGVLISITVIAVACYVLYHMLRGIDINEVIDAIKATDPSQIALAALFVAAGYFTLTFYDWFAVRAIGHAASPIASTRWPPSPPIRSATMSAPASSPAARCATGSIRPGG